MLGKILSAVIGAKIDQRDGDSGAKGALLGLLAPMALKRVLPIGLLVGGAVMAKRALNRRRTPADPASTPLG